MISKTARWLIGSMLVGGAAAYVSTMPEAPTPVAFQGPPQRAYDSTPGPAAGPRVSAGEVDVAALAAGGPADGFPAGAPAGEVANPVAAALDIDALNATRDRPLFTPSRTGPQAPAVEELPTRDFVEEVPLPMPPQVRLVGLMMIGDGGIALLRDENTGAVVRLREGEDYDGWAMHVVDDRSVTLSRDGEEHVMAMLVPGAPAPRPDMQGAGQGGYDPFAGQGVDPFNGGAYYPQENLQDNQQYNGQFVGPGDGMFQQQR